MPYTYYSSCVEWNPADVDRGLVPMIDDSRVITRGTFMSHVDRAEILQIEKDLGYEARRSQGLTMADDWHVSYHRSKLHGSRVYYFCWSGIEHVFTRS